MYTWRQQFLLTKHAHTHTVGVTVNRVIPNQWVLDGFGLCAEPSMGGRCLRGLPISLARWNLSVNTFVCELS